MPANAPIVINDGESTPVAHTMSPMDKVAGKSTYANLATAFVDGRETVSLAMGIKPKLREVVATLHIPRVLDETINGVTVSRVADFATLKVVGLLPKTWEEADLKNVRVLGSNLLLNAIVSAAFDRGESTWA